MERYIWRILLIDDDEEDYLITRQMLSEAREGDFILERAASFQTGQAALQADSFDAVLVDYDLGAQSGIELIREAVAGDYPAPILLLTRRGTYEVDVQAMEAGAADYLCKGEMNPAFLERAIRYAIERKKGEQALRESKLDLARAQAVAQIGSWRLDIRQNTLLWSDESYRIFDIQLGIPLTYEIFLSKVHPDDREYVDRSWMAALHGESYDIEHRIIVGDQIKWVRERAELEFDQQGALRGGFGTVQDITERKHAEHALRESESRFRIALANPALALFSADLQLRYTWFYSAAMGRLTDEWIGKRDDEILPVIGAAEMVELKQQVIETRAAVRGEILLGYAGQLRNMIVFLEPLFDQTGNLEGVTGAFLDVTEQRRLEAESFDHLTQMEVHHRLFEYREKERQEIACDLHDGPVQDLSGLVFKLAVLKETNLDPVLQLEFEQIESTLKQTVQGLRGMINELRPPALIRFGVTKAIQHYTVDFREKHPELEIQLDLHPLDHETRLSEQINLTLFRIYQEALDNILRHAQATRIWVRFRQFRDEVILEIYDDGKGFPVSDAFTKHTQEHHFGLAGMKERAHAAGGEFSLSSEPGKGTTIHVTIPLVGCK